MSLPWIFRAFLFLFLKRPFPWSRSDTASCSFCSVCSFCSLNLFNLLCLLSFSFLLYASIVVSSLSSSFCSSLASFKPGSKVISISISSSSSLPSPPLCSFPNLWNVFPNKLWYLLLKSPALVASPSLAPSSSESLAKYALKSFSSISFCDNGLDDNCKRSFGVSSHVSFTLECCNASVTNRESGRYFDGTLVHLSFASSSSNSMPSGIYLKSKIFAVDSYSVPSTFS